MARVGYVAVAATLVTILCVASVFTVSDAASGNPYQRRSLKHNTWQNPQVYSQKCPGDRDWHTTPYRSFWSLYHKFCKNQNFPVNRWGNYSELVLTKDSTSGYGSYNKYFTGRFTIKLKLHPGNSSGTVFAFYLSSDGQNYDDHDEIDIEFLGNETGKPITMQTNIFINGNGNREMRHNLWFDPSKEFHEYFIYWNSAMVLIGVDSIPIRVFQNNEKRGVPYLNKGQTLYVSHWDGSKWATQGGKIHIDYERNGPFVAKVKDFSKSINACRVNHERNVWACKHPGPKPFCWENGPHLILTQNQINLLRWVRKYCVYDYCQDDRRWPAQKMEKPKECNMLPY